MTVGVQCPSSTVDSKLTSFAQQIRDWAYGVKNLQEEFQTAAALEAAGYAAGDAATALAFIQQMWNVAGVYYGTVQQGGTGGTGAVEFNFDNSFAGLWAGQ